MSGRTYEFDGVIIGAGHNGLVLQAYLSRQGFNMALVERSLEVGSGLSTEESPIIPSFLHNMHAQIVLNLARFPWFIDLELDKFGLNYVHPIANCGMPFRNGKCIIIYTDIKKTYESIAKFSKRDADTYRKIYHQYREMGEKIFIPELLFATPSLGRRGISA